MCLKLRPFINTIQFIIDYDKKDFIFMQVNRSCTCSFNWQSQLLNEGQNKCYLWRVSLCSDCHRSGCRPVQSKMLIKPNDQFKVSETCGVWFSLITSRVRRIVFSSLYYERVSNRQESSLSLLTLPSQWSYNTNWQCLNSCHGKGLSLFYFIKQSLDYL